LRFSRHLHAVPMDICPVCFNLDWALIPSDSSNTSRDAEDVFQASYFDLAGLREGSSSKGNNFSRGADEFSSLEDKEEVPSRETEDSSQIEKQPKSIKDGLGSSKDDTARDGDHSNHDGELMSPVEVEEHTFSEDDMNALAQKTIITDFQSISVSANNG
jgi:hypothetical protein